MSEAALALGMLLCHAGATFYMVGLIWFVQRVHYPLLAGVGPQQFPGYERAHVDRTFSVVGPPMLLEAFTGIGLLADPDLNFGSVSLDEYMSTRGRVGICYETGWIEDPDNTPESVHAEMVNVLTGLGLLAGEARSFAEKRFLQLEEVVLCEAS